MAVGVGMIIIGACLLYVVKKLSRLGRLKFAYAMGWGVIGILCMFVAVTVLFLAPFLEAPLDTMVISIVCVGGACLVAVLVQLSISVSVIARQVEKVATRIAEIEHSMNRDQVHS